MRRDPEEEGALGLDIRVAGRYLHGWTGAEAGGFEALH